jgi:hypothetical protein
MKGKDISKKLAQKSSALMGLIDAMRGMDLEKVKGFKDKNSKKPDMEATMENHGEDRGRRR